MSCGLELRYRRALRLLPGYYRERWEEDMVAALLDSSRAGDPGEDERIAEAGRPSWPELVSVAGLAARLYLGGAGAPRRYFAWGQAVRLTVLAVILVHAVQGLDELVFAAWSRGLIVWLPAPSASMVTASAGVVWPTVWYVVGYAWLVIFVALLLGHYRAARILAVLAIAPDLIALVHAQVIGNQQPLFGPWVYWVTFNLAPVLAMAAFHADAPPVARRHWLLALPALCLLVAVPVLTALATGHSAWLSGFPGVCCMLVTLACLAHAPRARSSPADSGVWSLTLTLLAALAGIVRIATLGGYQHDPYLVYVGLAEALLLLAAVALIAPDAARAQTAMASSPPYSRVG